VILKRVPCIIIALPSLEDFEN